MKFGHCNMYYSIQKQLCLCDIKQSIAAALKYFLNFCLLNRRFSFLGTAITCLFCSYLLHKTEHILLHIDRND